jgi:hypothetical protein
MDKRGISELYLGEFMKIILHFWNLMVYYIPFTKKEVDRVIAENHANRESINFVVKFAAEDSSDGQRRGATRGQFSYEQFANWTFNDLYKLHIKPWKDLDPNVAPTTRMYK